MTIDSNEFRRVMGHFATGVTVVTTKCNGKYHGLTVNAFSSVSLEPLLVSVNISVHADSHDLIREAGVFAVNILTQDQEHISRVFADPRVEERFAGVVTYESETGAPIIEGCMAYLEARVEHVYDAGDHSIFVGRVVEQRVLLPDAPPLLYYRGNYAHLIPAPPEGVAQQVPRE